MPRVVSRHDSSHSIWISGLEEFPCHIYFNKRISGLVNKNSSETIIGYHYVKVSPSQCYIMTPIAAHIIIKNHPATFIQNALLSNAF